MTPAVQLVASAALILMAAAGALLPLVRARTDALTPLADPLEDERRSLGRALRELEEDRATGALPEEDYRTLRTETERRAVDVLRRISPQDAAPALRREIQELRDPGTSPRPGRRWVAALLVGTSIVGASIPLLAGSLRARQSGQAITGGTGPGASADNQDPLAFFQERVRQSPSNLVARLDLAHRYLDTGRVGAAAGQYAAALRLEPGNAEARAHVGFILFLAGRAPDGLRQVRRALAADPSYPEAWFIEGVILVKGLARPAEGRRALERYLELAPFGAERDTARALLAAIPDGTATASPSVTASASGG